MTFDQGGAEEPTKSADAESGTSPQAVPAPGVASPPAPAPNRLRRSLIWGGVAGLGVIAVKVALSLLAVSVAGHLLGAVFGGPYQRLPDDVRGGFEQRLDAALNHQLDGLSDADQKARLNALIFGGLPRLDDATVLAHLRLQVAAVAKADVPTCAAYARIDFAQAKAPTDLSLKLIALLDDAQLQQWAEINVEAIEAEVHKSPAARTVAASDVAPAFGTVLQSMPTADLATVQSMVSGSTVSDAAACSAERSINTEAFKLPPSDLALVARYVVGLSH